MHGARNFPANKPASNLDAALPSGMYDAEYLDSLTQHLPLAMDASRADAVICPASADAFIGDRMGLLALTKAGLAAGEK